MSIDSASPPEVARIEHFEAMLVAALDDARRWDYDLPTEAGLDRARELFADLAGAFDDISGFEVDVAIDGAIELTAGSARATVTIDIAHDGRRIDGVTGDHIAKSVTWSVRDPGISAIIAEIARAA